MATILQWNCRGYFNNSTDLKDLINEHQPVLVALQETNFTRKDDPRLRGYSFHRKDRTDAGRASGGVALLISNSIPAAHVALYTHLEAVAARISIGRSLTVCSIYLPEGIVNSTDLDNLIPQLPSPFIILGDFNGHSPQWGCVDTNVRGRKVEDLLVRHSLTLSNTGSVTYFHAPTRTFTAIDLTISSPVLLPFINWRVGADLMGSDHFPIIIGFHTRHRCQVTRPPRWNLEKADWDSFQLSADFSTVHLSSISVEDAVTRVTNIIIKAAEANIPITSTKFRSYPKPWWNDDCEKARKLCGRAWDIFRRYPTSTNCITYKRARAKFRYIRRQSQRDSWRKFTSSINSSSSPKLVWEKVRKFSGSYSPTTIPMLTDNGTTLSQLPEIANSLGKSFASHSSETFYSPQFRAIKERAEQVRLDFRSRKSEDFNRPFTKVELKIALNRSKDCAVGPDRIHYSFIKHLSEASLDKLLEFFNKIWNDQQYPNSWRRAIVIAILKPGKDPTDPKGYRPIALTSCLGKVLERMVNARLIWYLETNNIISNTQCGFRKHRSTMDHLIRLESSIRDAFLRREHLVSIFFDIEKAYDTTWKYGILRDLHGFGLRGNLPVFLANFLANRTFKVRVGTTLSKSFPQEQGVPQGSVLSVTLFSIKINSITSTIPPTVENGLYVDDFHASCHSCNMRAVERQLQRALYRLDEWAINNGFRFSLDKTVVVHFSRRRGLYPDPSLFLGGQELPVVTETKFLGLVLDRKLTFGPHLKALRVKCAKTLNILRVLSGTSWGADRTTLLHLYRSLVRSKLDYASPVYHSARASTLKILDPIHHQALRLCTGAFRTSPIQSLYAEASEPPLAIRRSQLSLQYAAKIKTLPEHPTWSSIFDPKWEALYSRRVSAIPSFGIRIKNTLTELHLPLQLESVNILDHPPWQISLPEYNTELQKHPKANTPNPVYLQLFTEHRHRHQSYRALYTDGSKSADGVASAYICCSSAVSRRLPSEASVYTAELFAIDMALNHITSARHDGCIIYTDSHSSVLALQSLSTSIHPVIRAIRKRLQFLASRKTRIQFCWIPGHAGIAGNETVDKAARSANNVGVPEIQSVVPYTDYRSVFRERLHQQWQSVWATQQANKLFFIKPTIKLWANSTRKNRREEVVLARLRIGHTFLTHIHLLLGEDEPECEVDEVPLTIKHIFTSCTTYSAERYTYFGDESPTLDSILGGDVEDFKPLFAFLKETGLYTRF